MKKQQSGFTLIELVMVIVILGILAASFAPKFVDLSGDSYDAKNAGISGAAKAALTVSIAELKRSPTVAELAANVQGGTVTAIATGLDFGNIDPRDGTPEVALTYQDGACSVPTTATTGAGSTVNCVASIP